LFFTAKFKRSGGVGRINEVWEAYAEETEFTPEPTDTDPNPTPVMINTIEDAWNQIIRVVWASTKKGKPVPTLTQLKEYAKIEYLNSVKPEDYNGLGFPSWDTTEIAEKMVALKGEKAIEDVNAESVEIGTYLSDTSTRYSQFGQSKEQQSEQALYGLMRATKAEGIPIVRTNAALRREIERLNTHIQGDTTDELLEAAVKAKMTLAAYGYHGSKIGYSDYASALPATEMDPSLAPAKFGPLEPSFIDFFANAPTLQSTIRNNPFGFTIDREGESQLLGYVVAPRKNTEKNLSEGFTDDDLRAYIIEHADILSLPGARIGGWFTPETNQFTLDVSFAVEKAEDALTAALAADQDAIWDLQNGYGVNTKIKNPDGTYSQTPTLPRVIDGRDANRVIAEVVPTIGDVALFASEKAYRDTGRMGLPSDGGSETTGAAAGLDVPTSRIIAEAREVNLSEAAPGGSIQGGFGRTQRKGQEGSFGYLTGRFRKITASQAREKMSGYEYTGGEHIVKLDRVSTSRVFKYARFEDKPFGLPVPTAKTPQAGYLSRMAFGNIFFEDNQRIENVVTDETTGAITGYVVSQPFYSKSRNLSPDETRLILASLGWKKHPKYGQNVYLSQPVRLKDGSEGPRLYLTDVQGDNLFMENTADGGEILRAPDLIVGVWSDDPAVREMFPSVAELLELHPDPKEYGISVPSQLDGILAEDKATADTLKQLKKDAEEEAAMFADLLGAMDDLSDSSTSGVRFSQFGGAQDTEYLAAVERGDTETLQRMVDVASGNKETVFRGQKGFQSKYPKSSKGLFGIGQKIIPTFWTTSESLARDYSRDGEYKGSATPSAEAQKGIPAWEYENVWTRSDGFKYTTTDTTTDKAVAERAEERGRKVKETRVFPQTATVQSAKLFFKNPLVLDANGAIWREVSFKGKKMSTDEIAEYAFKNGYDGVEIKNVRDSFAGLRSKDTSNVLVSFNPEQVKSADSVTYDDRGNVIPLSQRFGDSGDIRYSQFGALTATPEGKRHAELEAKFNSGTITEEETAEVRRLVDEAARSASTAASKPFDVSDPKLGARYRAMEGYGIWMTPSGRTIPVDNHAQYAKGFFREKNSDEGVGSAFGQKWIIARAVKGGDWRSDTDTLYVETSGELSSSQNKNLKDWALFHGYEISITKQARGYPLRPFTGVPLDQRFNPETSDIRYSQFGAQGSGVSLPSTFPLEASPVTIKTTRSEDEGYNVIANGKPTNYSIKNRKWGWEIHIDGNWDQTFETKKGAIEHLENNIILPSQSPDTRYSQFGFSGKQPLLDRYNEFDADENTEYFADFLDVLEIAVHESGTYKSPVTFLQRLFQGEFDPRYQRIKQTERAFSVGAAAFIDQERQALLEAVEEAYGSSTDIAANSLISQAFGSTALPLSVDEVNALRESRKQRHLAAIAAATPEAVEARAQILIASGTEALEAQIEARNSIIQEGVLQANQDSLDEEIKARKVHSDKIVAAKNSALKKLEQQAPEVRTRVLRIRRFVDEQSRRISKSLGEGDPLRIVLDNQLGIYVTRSYQFFNDEGYRDAILDSKNKNYMTYEAERQAARKFFEDQFLETRTLELMEEKFGLDEDGAKQQAMAEIKERSVGKGVGDELMLRWLDSLTGGPVPEDTQRPQGRDDASMRVIANNLKQRKDVPKPLRDLLRELDEEQGIEQILRTATTVSAILANQKTLAKVYTWGRSNENPEDRWLLTRAEYEALDYNTKRTYEIFPVKNGGASIRNPLAGHYAPTALTEALDNLSTKEHVEAQRAASQRAINGAMDFAVKATGFSMALNVLFSLGHYARNILGYTATSIGVGRPSLIYKSAPSLKREIGRIIPKEAGRILPKRLQSFLSMPDDKFNVERLRLVGLNIDNDSVNAGTLKDMLSGRVTLTDAQNQIKTLSEQAQSAVGKAVQPIMDKLGELEAATETFFKIAYFYDTLETLEAAKAEGVGKIGGVSVANLSNDTALYHEAARQTLMVLPSHSQTMPLVTEFTKSGFGLMLAPFLRFKSEMIRTPINNIKLAMDEINSGNSVLRKRGVARMSGMITVLAGSAALPAIVSSVFGGLDPDEDEALRKTMPKYLRDHSFFYFEFNGQLKSIDFTYVNPYSGIGDSFNKLWRGAVQGDPMAPVEAITTFLTNNFLDDQILAGAVSALRENRDPTTGLPIYEDVDTAAVKAGKSLKFLGLEAYGPRVLTDAIKVVAAAKEGANSPGYEVQDIVLNGMMPFRIHTLDVPQQFRRYLYEHQQQYQRAGNKLNVVLAKRAISPEDVAGAYDDMIHYKKLANEDLLRTALAFTGPTLGVPLGDADAMMRDSGVSKQRIANLNDRVMDKTIPSKDFVDKLLRMPEGRARGQILYDHIQRKPRYFELDIAK
jgi:hypothetical protein